MDLGTFLLGAAAGGLAGSIAAALLLRARAQTALARARAAAAAEIAALGERVATRDQQIARLEGELHAREATVVPMSEALARLDARLGELGLDRARSDAELGERLRALGTATLRLQGEATRLVQALRNPGARGRWGEMQLRRVVEVAGLSEHCDFTEQPSVTGEDRTGRPDLVVHLPGGGDLAIDAKVPLTGWIESLDAPDEESRAARLGEQARHLRARVDELARRGYWEALKGPDMVVLFLPGEGILAWALEHDADLLEHAATRRVMLATPATLIALLRTVAAAWSERHATENARAIRDLGSQVHAGIHAVARHLEEVRRTLTGAVNAYNATAASVEDRLVSAARRLSELGTPGGGTVAKPKTLDRLPRPSGASAEPPSTIPSQEPDP